MGYVVFGLIWIGVGPLFLPTMRLSLGTMYRNSQFALYRHWKLGKIAGFVNVEHSPSLYGSGNTVMSMEATV